MSICIRIYLGLTFIQLATYGAEAPRVSFASLEEHRKNPPVFTRVQPLMALARQALTQAPGVLSQEKSLSSDLQDLAVKEWYTKNLSRLLRYALTSSDLPVTALDMPIEDLDVLEGGRFSTHDTKMPPNCPTIVTTVSGVWQEDTGKLIKKIPQGSRIRGILPSGHYLCDLWGGVVNPDGTREKRLDGGGTDRVFKTIVLKSGCIVTGGLEGTIKRWNENLQCTDVVGTCGSSVSSLHTLSDGKSVVVVAKENIQVWDLGDLRHVCTLTDEQGKELKSPQSPYVLSNDDVVVRYKHVCSSVTGKTKYTFGDHVLAADVLPTGKVVAFSYQSGKLYIHNADDGVLEREIEISRGEIRSMLVLPGGDFAGCFMKGSIIVFNGTTYEPMYRLENYKRRIDYSTGIYLLGNQNIVIGDSSRGIMLHVMKAIEKLLTNGSREITLTRIEEVNRLLNEQSMRVWKEEPQRCCVLL